MEIISAQLWKVQKVFIHFSKRPDREASKMFLSNFQIKLIIC